MTTHVKHKEHDKPSWNKVVLLTLTLILTLIAWACTQCVTGVTRMELVGFDPSETYFQYEHVPLDQVYLRIAFDDQSEHQKYLHDPAIVVRGSILPDLSLDTENVGENFVVHIYYAGFSYHIYFDVISPGIIVRAGESIQAAINVSEPGDVILVEAGIYEETLVIPVDKTGITLRSLSGAEETIVKNIDVELEPVTLRIQADDVIVEGLTFTKDGEKSHQDEVGILLEGVERVAVVNNYLIQDLSSLIGTGILVKGSSHNNIEDNLVSNYDIGISLKYSSTYGHSSHNQTVSNLVTDCKVGIGILSSSNIEKGFMEGNIVLSNTIINNVVQDSFGIRLISSGHIHNFLIEANTIEGVDTGISFRELGSYEFSNNNLIGNILINIISIGFDVHRLRGHNNQFSENLIESNGNPTNLGMRFTDVLGLNNLINENLISGTVSGIEFHAAITLHEGEFQGNRLMDVSGFSLTLSHFMPTSHLNVNANFNYWGSPNNPQDKINIIQGTVVIDTWYLDEDLTTTNKD